VVWVAKAGGDFTSVAAALASITDNDATHRYVVKIAPGTYTEANGIDMKDYVDIAGSGQTATTITATFSAASTTTVRATGSMHAELRDLTIINTGGGASGVNAVGVRVTNTTPNGALRITDVTVQASGAISGGATNYAVYVDASAPIITSLTASTSGNGNGVAFSNLNASPTMTDITATTSNTGIPNAAVQNSGTSAPIMNHITALANGAGFLNYGIFDQDSSSPRMDDVTATAINAGSNYGVGHNSSGTATLTDVTAYAGYGVYVGSGTVLIRDSFLTGFPISIYRAGGAVQVSDTELQSPVNGLMTCINAYNTAYVELGLACT